MSGGKARKTNGDHAADGLLRGRSLAFILETTGLLFRGHQVTGTDEQ